MRKTAIVALFMMAALQQAVAMSASSVPTYIPTPWGTSAPGGNITCPIPIPSQIAVQAGRASWTDGFPPLTFLNVNAGGIPPFGQDFNGVLCQLSQWTRWYNAGAAVPYNSAFQSAVGGYPKGAIVASVTSPGLFWVSTVDNNTANPDTGGANWTTYPQPNVKAISGTKTISNFDCNTTQALGGNAFYTLTFPAASSVVSGCQITVVDTDVATPVGKTIVIPGISTGYVLYPTEQFVVANIGGTWTYTQWPTRWKNPQGATIQWYVNFLSGSDVPGVADGLSASRPLQRANTAIYAALAQIDCNGGLSETQTVVNLAPFQNDSYGMHVAFHDAVGCQGGATFQVVGASLPVIGAANNGSGAIRLTLNSTAVGYFNNEPVVVYGVGGTTEANRAWLITIVDGTHLDLQGSTFTNAFTSPGTITEGSGFDVTNAACIDTYFGTVLQVSNLLFSGVDGISANYHSMIYFEQGNLFDNITGTEINVGDSSYIEADYEYGILNNFGYHVSASLSGQFLALGNIDFLGASEFTIFAAAQGNSGVAFQGPINTNGNAVTGQKCSAVLNGVVNSGTGAPNSYFPGSINCSASLGGVVN